jgi:hypothetical protein
VLVLKYVDLGVISLTDVVSWLLQQDESMRHLWAWELTRVVYEKATRGNESEMQVDSNGASNGVQKSNPREVLEKIIADVDGCYQRQTELDKEWVKEWFAMVVRLFGTDVEGVTSSAWANEILSAAQEYHKHLTDMSDE